jgi:hypothetical protein
MVFISSARSEMVRGVVARGVGVAGDGDRRSAWLLASLCKMRETTEDMAVNGMLCSPAFSLNGSICLFWVLPREVGERRVARFLVLITDAGPGHAMCGVGCHHATSTTGLWPGVKVNVVGRVWPIVMEVDTHAGKMLGRLPKIWHENRQMGRSCLD